MASPFGKNFIEALGALEYIRQQQEQRTSQSGLQAMQLLSKQGTFNPVPKEQVGIAGNLLGLLPPDQYKVGGNVLQFQPYPEVDIPGYGKLRLPPEDAAKMAMQRNENEQFANDMSALYQARAQSRPTLPEATSITEEPIVPPVRPMTSQAPALPSSLSRWQPIIAQAAQATGLPPALLASVMLQESGGDPNALGRVTKSGQQAIGLMQIMPATAAELNIDPNIPEQNIMGGARYLKQQLDAFGGDLPKALAAYNAGPGAVQQYGGIPPYPETQGYVKGVSSRYQSMGGPSQMVAGAATPRPQILPSDRRLDSEISTIDDQMEAIEGRIVAMAKRGTKSKDAIESAQGQLTRLQARRDRLEDQLSAPALEARKAAARAPVELELEEKKGQLRTREEISKRLVTGPMDTRQDVLRHEAQSDMMTDADKLIAKDLGIKASRYSQISPEDARAMRESRQAMDVDSFVARTVAQSEVLDGRQRKAKQRETLLDLRKTEAVIDEVYQSWKQYTNPNAGVMERGKAGLQMRKLGDGLGGALARLIDKGVLTNQDREKAEGLLPGLTTGIIDPGFGEQNFEAIRRLLGTWRGVVNDVYGGQTAQPDEAPGATPQPSTPVAPSGQAPPKVLGIERVQ